jgi:DNA-binding IscR family transcriptional regulator
MNWMLPRTAEYALAAMAHLAGQDPGFCTVPAIAGGAGVPSRYANKVVNCRFRQLLLPSAAGIR